MENKELQEIRAIRIELGKFKNLQLNGKVHNIEPLQFVPEKSEVTLYGNENQYIRNGDYDKCISWTKVSLATAIQILAMSDTLTVIATKYDYDRSDKSITLGIDNNGKLIRLNCNTTTLSDKPLDLSKIDFTKEDWYVYLTKNLGQTDTVPCTLE